jgi:hypothetical protein
VAIAQAHADSMLLDNNQFIDNLTTDGVGGGLLYDRNSDTLAVRDNLLHMNTAETNGGGAFFSHDTAELFTISSNRFTANHAYDDGGVLALSGFAGIQDYELDRNAFLSYSANDNAGALLSAQSARPWIYNRVMAFNVANRGGAISTVNTYVYLWFSTLLHNEAALGAQIYGFSGTLDSLSSSILAHPIGDKKL